MHTIHVTRFDAATQAAVSAKEKAWWRWGLFWLPTLLILLVVVIPDFEVRYAQSAGGVEVESDLVATMATENSIRENAFLLNLLALGAAGASLFLFASRQSENYGSRHLWIIVVTLAYIGSSLFWSDDRSLTFRRLVIASFFVIGAWGVGRAWRPMHLVQMVLLLSATFAISGIVAEIYCGTFLASSGYRFSGMLHPNRQALSCGLFVLAAMIMKAKTGNYLYWFLAAVGFGLLILTGSRGGAAACAIAVAFQFFLAAPSNMRLVWCLLVAVFFGGGLLYLAVDPSAGRKLEVLARMGRSDALSDPKSLTGRIPIWGEMTDGIKESPIVGHGFAAYWTAERVHRLSYIHDWEFNNAHSSFLDVILSLGIVGFSLGVVGVLTIFARGVQLNGLTNDPGLVFILSIFVMAFMSGLVESTFVSVGYEFLVWLIGAFLIVYYPQPGSQGRTS